jgi:SAM-dependent methyltransferase
MSLKLPNAGPDLRRDSLLRIGNDRLYPSLTNPNYLVLRARRMIFRNWLQGLNRQNLTILDVGGRYQPYRPLFEKRIGLYVALDVLKTELVDVVATGELLPFVAQTFDLVIATQVFEYFPEPFRAAEQMHSVLKPGGILLMSVAAVAPRFVDEEHWRFTPSGIRSTLSSFRKVEVIPETYSGGGLIRTVNVFMHSFAHFGLLRRLTELSLCPLLNLAGLGIEGLNLTHNEQFTPNYSVLAVK